MRLPVLALAMASSLIACAGPALNRDVADLTSTDRVVLRTVIADVIEPRVRRFQPGIRPLIVSPTKTIALQTDLRPVTSPEPPPFGVLPSRLPTPGTLDGGMLTDAEREAWIVRNRRRARTIDDLGLGGYSSGPAPDGQSSRLVRISLSAPAYPTHDSAILYGDYRCGGTCGEGLLVRLIRGARGWFVTGATILWVS